MRLPRNVSSRSPVKGVTGFDSLVSTHSSHLLTVCSYTVTEHTRGAILINASFDHAYSLVWEYSLSHDLRYWVQRYENWEARHSTEGSWRFIPCSNECVSFFSKLHQNTLALGNEHSSLVTKAPSSHRYTNTYTKKHPQRRVSSRFQVCLLPHFTSTCSYNTNWSWR